MSRRRALLLLLSGSIAISCSKRDAIPAGPVADLGAESIVARVDGGQLEIRNESSRRIYFATLERHYFETALALWCFGHSQCGVVLDPGRTARVEVAKIGGYNDRSTEAIVFWWPDRPDPTGEAVASDVKQIVVRLR